MKYIIAATALMVFAIVLGMGQIAATIVFVCWLCGFSFTFGYFWGSEGSPFEDGSILYIAGMIAICFMAWPRLWLQEQEEKGK